MITHTSDTLLSHVVATAHDQLIEILDQFDLETRELIVECVFEEPNWACVSQIRRPTNSIERCFECKPMNRRLHAYVVTTPDDTTIVTTYFLGT